MDQYYILTEESDFRSIVKAIDQLGMGYIAVIDVDGYLKGLVTDGDIRKAILRSDYDINSLINTRPEVMDYMASQREIVARLKELERRNMPLVDEDGKLKSVFSLEDIEFTPKENTVVIMAGGLGSRLGELTKETPKPMLCVGKKPMLQHLIEMFSDHGYSKFLLCVNYKKEVIKDYFQNGRSLGVQIDYIEEDKRLGTAGALSLINSAPENPFFVINGDILTTVDFDDLLKFHLDSASVATMCVRKHSYKIPYGVVNTDESNEIISIEEKPTAQFNINAGVYILDPVALELVPKDTYFDMPSLFELLISKKHKASVYQISDYWLDIGRVEDFEQANLDLML